ncbi:MAG: transcriptional regulator [Clostridiales bacterium]|nr:transcriptional regulator [Clostridiales bacterium]
MKLVLAIVNNDDSAMVAAQLTNAGYATTKLSTTGGFLMAGNTTFLIGADDNQVADIKAIIAQFSSTREKEVPTNASFGRGMSLSDVKSKAHVSGATLFVLNVEEFEKL